jgi:hypothetical protein
VRSSSRVITIAFAGLLFATVGGAAFAADDALDAGDDEAPPRGLQPIGAGTNDAPRLMRSDLVLEPRRSLPGYRHEASELSYRWWASSGRADLGVGLGTLTYVVRPTGSVPGLAGDDGARAIAAGTVLTMGMRYRTSARSAVFADASGVRGAGFDSGDAVVGKVGLEFKAAQSRWNVSYGGLGFKLAGDARMTLRLRRGGFGIYMRSAF